jgi:hypothetical protein
MTEKTKDAVVEQLFAWLEAAAEARFGADPDGLILSVPDYAEGPQAFVQQLISGRRRADYIEELLGKAKRVRGRLVSNQKDAADVANEKFDRALVAGQSTRPEYSMGIERKAEANLLSFEEKRAERLAQRRVDAADEVVDALKDMHFGLSGWRNDMRDIIRSFQLESNLER